MKSVHVIYKHGHREQLPPVMICSSKEIAERELLRLEEEEKKNEANFPTLQMLSSAKRDKWYYSEEMNLVV